MKNPSFACYGLLKHRKLGDYVERDCSHNRKSYHLSRRQNCPMSMLGGGERWIVTSQSEILAHSFAALPRKILALPSSTFSQNLNLILQIKKRQKYIVSLLLVMSFNPYKKVSNMCPL